MFDFGFPVLYLAWQCGIFYYWEEAGAANLRPIIPVALLGEMGRWIPSTSLRKSRGTNTAYLL